MKMFHAQFLAPQNPTSAMTSYPGPQQMLLGSCWRITMDPCISILSRVVCPPLLSHSRADLNEAGETPSSYYTGSPTPTFSPGPFLWLYFRSKQEKECAECFPPCAPRALIPASHMSSKGRTPSFSPSGSGVAGAAQLLSSLLPCPLP